MQQSLLARRWQPQRLEQNSVSLSDPQALAFTRQEATLLLTQTAYSECLQLADLAIAMAGTATEQWVGTGKAAIAFPGRGLNLLKLLQKPKAVCLGLL